MRSEPQASSREGDVALSTAPRLAALSARFTKYVGISAYSEHV